MIFSLKKLSRKTVKFLFQSVIEVSPLKKRILFRLPPHLNAVALTFDDGPVPETTPLLLDILAEHQARATFFLVGERARQYPEIIQRIVAEGHTVGNHTFTHPRPSRLSVKELRKEIERTEETILQAEPTATPKFYRPPWGETPFPQIRTVMKMGYRLIYWRLDTKDFSATTPLDIINAGATIRNRDIILLHDRQSLTVEALPKILSSLREKQLVCVSLSQIQNERN
jgi:peptidoglycan/xylan/chitin deacetylase (PgdA/CDA1 family)